MKSLALAALLLLAAPLRAADPPKLDGVWLFDECTTGNDSDLRRFWSSVVTVKGDRFTLTKLMNNPKDLTGRLVFDPADPDTVDLVLDELEFGVPKVKVLTGGTYRGKFDAKADRFTLAIARAAGEKRPEKLEPSQTTYFAALTRAPAGFKAFPKEVTVRVTGPDGKPVADANVGTFMVSRQDPKGRESRREWRYHDPMKTGPDGTVKVNFDAPPIVVRDATNRHIAFPVTTPARLAGGELPVKLVPEHTVAGRVMFGGPEKAEVAHVHLLHRDERIAQIDLKGGGFDFPVVPGS